MTMTDEAKRVADDVAATMEDLPALSDMDSDDTVVREVSWFDHPRKDTSGWSISALFGIDPDVWTEYVEEHIEPKVDRRRLKSGTSTTVGHLKFNGDGEIVDHGVKSGFLKPSERGN